MTARVCVVEGVGDTYNEQLCPLYVWLGGDGLMEGRGGDHYAKLLANNQWRRVNLARRNPLAMTVSLLRPP